MNKAKKRIVYVICAVLLSVMVIMGAGKSSWDQERCARSFIEDFYTMTDYEMYSFTRQNPYSNEYTSERLMKESFSGYFTQEGIEEFAAGDVTGIFENMAASSGCTSQIGKLSLTRNRDASSGADVAFDFSAVVEVVDRQGNESSVEQRGMVLVDKKEMKISSFYVMNSRSVIDAVSSMY